MYPFHSLKEQLLSQPLEMQSNSLKNSFYFNSLEKKNKQALFFLQSILLL